MSPLSISAVVLVINWLNPGIMLLFHIVIPGMEAGAGGTIL
jgi:hypothetical protein